MKDTQFLPLGSIVLLKDATKTIMITGYMQKTVGEDKLYDYAGCLYPEGFISADKNLLFNNDQIQEAIFTGYECDESKEFINKIGKIKEVISSKENIDEIEML